MWRGEPSKNGLCCENHICLRAIKIASNGMKIYLSVCETDEKSRTSFRLSLYAISFLKPFNRATRVCGTLLGVCTFVRVCVHAWPQTNYSRHTKMCDDHVTDGPDNCQHQLRTSSLEPDTPTHTYKWGRGGWYQAESHWKNILIIVNAKTTCVYAKTCKVCVCVCMCGRVLRRNRQHVRHRGREMCWREWKSQEPAVFRRPAGITFCSLHLLLHTHELQLPGSASKISEAVVVVLKHHSTCTNSHKYSCPWTWIFFFPFLLYSCCVSVQEWGSREGCERDWKRRGKEREHLKKRKKVEIRVTKRSWILSYLRLQTHTHTHTVTASHAPTTTKQNWPGQIS